MKNKLKKRSNRSINFDRSLSPVPNENDLDLSDSFDNFFNKPNEDLTEKVYPTF
jgi:hypothetical protein